MERISKRIWKEMKDNGFLPKYPVTRTSHGRYYFVTDIDYDKYMENQGKKVGK